MNKERIKDIIKSIFIIGGIALFIYFGFFSKEQSGAVPEYELTEKEKLEIKIDELERKNEEYEEKIGHLQSRIEELEGEYKNSEELIDILREQLESYGIEPDDL